MATLVGEISETSGDRNILRGAVEWGPGRRPLGWKLEKGCGFKREDPFFNGKDE